MKIGRDPEPARLRPIVCRCGAIYFSQKAAAKCCRPLPPISARDLLEAEQIAKQQGTAQRLRT